MAYTTDAARWRALATRDAEANGHFIYTVKSTNIYCRPTCPGRLARRANVGFFKTAAEAEAAGFRACKRCKPNAIQEDPQERAVEKACLLIEKGLNDNDPKAIRLQDLAKKVGLTPRYFHKIFKDKTGVTPKEYAKAKMMIQNSASVSPVVATDESSVPTRIGEAFDFNDLVDFGADLSPTLTDDLITEAESIPSGGLGTEFDVNSLLPTWDAGYKSNGTDLGNGIIDDKLLDTFEEVMAASFTFQEEKTVSALSTLELDAAVVLGSNGLSDLVLAHPIYH